MDKDWELEDWLLEAGERAEEKATAGRDLTPVERLVREFWVFDICVRNGGISQYFCNNGLARWQELKSAWLPREVPSLGPILREVDRVIANAHDPYSATLNASPTIEELYEAQQPLVCQELRSLS